MWLHSPVTQVSELYYCPSAHLSAGLCGDEASDGTVVVIVCPDENPEEGRLRAAPLHGLWFSAQLHLHRCLTPRVSFYTQ